MELQQRVSHARLGQTFHVATIESIQSAVWMRESLRQIEVMPSIVLERLIELRVHGFHLSLGRCLRKVRGNKELR